jgi:3-oxoacyl-[acyl-carrier protein] reductase
VGMLSGQHAVVTGAAQGIGLAIAQRFAVEGADVLVADINIQGARVAAKLIERDGGTALAVEADVRSSEDVNRIVQNAHDHFGGVTIMVNNAGAPDSAPMLDMTEHQFQSVVDVHLRGAWLGTRAAARAMRDHGGSIINISSISGKVGIVEQTNYSAAKAGVIGLTKAAAREFGGMGIRVNCILPGTIRTERTALKADTAEWAAKLADVPLRREGTPDEVAGVALFLASALSGYVTGAGIEVAGGRYA